MINFDRKKISGWAKSHHSICDYIEITDENNIEEVFSYAKKNNKKISFRGGGRSYGDNILNKNNIVLKIIPKIKIFSFDNTNGKIEVSGSCTLIELLNYLIPKGWILNVSPASQFISIAGAISNNVHGKNCPAKGYFGDYVEEIEILTPDKGIIKCSNIENAELYNAVISGLGCFGIILKAKIKLRKIKTAKINTQVFYVQNIDSAVEKSQELIHNYEFNIGSLNFTRFNKRVTNGIIYSSNFSETEDLNITKAKANLFIYAINLGLMSNNIPYVDKFIEYAFSKITSQRGYGKKEIKQDYCSMNFLGDKYLPLYNNLFKNGFIEYQVIFDKNYYLNAIHEIENLLYINGYSSYMSSFKLYKPSSEKYMLGLNKDGFCLTLDIPVSKNDNFELFTRKLNEITIKHNGQVYLGKTPCINNEEFKEMYKNYYKFKSIKENYDSNFLIVSEMTARIFSDIYNYKY